MLPIRFATSLIPSVLDGTKTQTRRLVKPQPAPGESIACPYVVGERRWVQEEWHPAGRLGREAIIEYLADRSERVVEAPWSVDVDHLVARSEWVPASEMPEWASRATIEITAVRVERVQSITEEDARAEGVAPAWLDEDGKSVNWGGAPTFRQGFARLWSEIYGLEAWARNDVVWVVGFGVVEGAREAGE